MGAQTTLSGKGQIVIPVEVRRRLRLHPGARFSVIEQAGEIRLKPLANDRPFARTTTADLDRLPRWTGPAKSIEEISRLSDQTVRDAIAGSTGACGRLTRTSWSGWSRATMLGQKRSHGSCWMTSFFSCQPVLLESEWVLRSVYKLRRTDIARALYTVLGHDNAVVWSVAAVANALRAYEAGADLADALHTELAVEAGATRFATFDKQIKSDAVENELLLAATT